MGIGCYVMYIINTTKRIHVHVHTNYFTKNSVLGVGFNVCYVFYILKIHIHIHVLAQCTHNITQDIVYWVLGSTCIISYLICVNVDMYTCSYITIKEIGCRVSGMEFWILCVHLKYYKTYPYTYTHKSQ